MDHIGSGWLGRTLRVNKETNQILLNREFKCIKILDLDEKGDAKSTVELSGIGGLIWDHQPIGHNKVAILRRDGWLRVQQYNFEGEENHVLSEYKIELSKEKSEYACTLSVCDKNKIIVVHIGASDYKASRMLFFHFQANVLELRCNIDIIEENISFLQAMEIYGYSGNHLSLCAITLNNPALILTFNYNTVSFKGEEILKLRKQVNASYCYKLEKIGKKLVTSDENARKITIFYKF